MNFSAVVLAGGKSSRMGCDKARLAVDGKTLLARQINLAREIGAAEIFVSGSPGKDYSEFGCQVLHDKFPEAGPLAGVERALATASLPLLFVLAVDLPKLNAEFLQRLAAGCSGNSGIIPRLGDRIEPLVAFYPTSAAPLAEAALQAGHHAVSTFASGCVNSGLARFMNVSPQDAVNFTNWNSPADLAAGDRRPALSDES